MTSSFTSVFPQKELSIYRSFGIVKTKKKTVWNLEIKTAWIGDKIEFTNRESRQIKVSKLLSNEKQNAMNDREKSRRKSRARSTRYNNSKINSFQSNESREAERKRYECNERLCHFQK